MSDGAACVMIVACIPSDVATWPSQPCLSVASSVLLYMGNANDTRTYIGGECTVDLNVSSGRRWAAVSALRLVVIVACTLPPTKPATYGSVCAILFPARRIASAVVFARSTSAEGEASAWRYVPLFTTSIYTSAPHQTLGWTILRTGTSE